MCPITKEYFMSFVSSNLVHFKVIWPNPASMQLKVSQIFHFLFLK